MSSPSWRKIADRLAARLIHHAYCGDHHDPPDPINCPACDDVDAIRAYWEKGGGIRLLSNNDTFDADTGTVNPFDRSTWPLDNSSQ